jgi:hypothetical protein
MEPDTSPANGKKKPGRKADPNKPAKAPATPRVKRPLTDFGKAVAKHLIDTEQTRADLAKSAGLTPHALSQMCHGLEEAPMSWIDHPSLPAFMREAAVGAHRDTIERNYAALQSFLGADV